MAEGLDFDDETILVGALRLHVEEPRNKKQKVSLSPASGAEGGSAGGKRGRHVVWHPPAGQYVCVRPGDLIVQNIRDLDSLGQTPSESNFWIFHNTDPNAGRNPHVPLYEAVYKCADGTLVRVQKKHLKIAYTHCGRKDVKRAWSLLCPPGGAGGAGAPLPYWVDRYAFCKVKG